MPRSDDTPGPSDNTPDPSDDADPTGTPEPPETRREVVTETLHGTEIADPYRWLERDDESVRAWTAAQNEYADALLDTPARDRLRSRMESFAEVAEYGPVKTAGGRYFQTVREPGDDHARLLVRESPDSGEEASLPEGEGTVLADPNERPADSGKEKARSLAWFLPAPDGEQVAYGAASGDENVDVRVVSVPEAETVAVREDCGRVFLGFVGFDAVSPGTVAWDADGAGLYYVATEAESGGGTTTELRHWRFDGREEFLLDGGEAEGWPLVGTDPESGTLAVAFHDVSGTDWYVRSEDDGEDEGPADAEFRPVVTGSDAETFAVFRDGRVFLQTDREAPRKRVLACSLDRFREGGLDLAACETVLPEREAVLQSFAVTDDHLVAHYLDDAHSRLAVFDRGGRHLRDLPLPDSASVSHLRSGDSEAVFYRVESFHRPPSVVRADLASGETCQIARTEVPRLPENLVVRREFADSADGTEVPVFVCHREDVDPDGDNPAVLHGYGGFRSSRPPDFDRFRLPFLADGGVYARVCARGGHEYGESWHEAATRGDKQRTFDDFVAAGEFLRDAGYADPDRLAVVGRSNGGLSVGAVLTQRPDLWAAARCSVPLLDVLRYHRFGMGEAWTGEYGDPEDPAAFAHLRDYSPYHNVESGARTMEASETEDEQTVEYPPVLFVTGESDTRVHPCHARKMAARMQQEADGGPFVLRTRRDSGHGGGSSAGAVVAEQAEEWAFLYDHLGIER